MDNNVIRVIIWGKPVGLMYWDKRRRVAIFEYDPQFVKSGIDIAPTTMSIKSPRSINGIAWEGERDKLYQGLPPVFADSLPDQWGSALFNAWLQSRHLRTTDVSPVDKLAYIGSRGMGALEFAPALEVGEDDASSIDLQELYRFAQTVLGQRENEQISAGQSLLWHDLIKIGTSAGGRRPKAMIAYNEATGEIRSGQTLAPEGFGHYILKFDEQAVFPFTRVEFVYYLLAQKAGINMMPSRLLSFGGQCHFMTMRFDRRENQKLHLQTMAAMNPLGIGYEDIFRIMRRLNLPAAEFSEQFRRMVFNVVGCNVDDHNKNFSFLMEADGTWKLSPAYDLTFSKDLSAPEYANRHSMTINGKNSNISFADLEKVARENDILHYKEIIDSVNQAFASFCQLAHQQGVNAAIANSIASSFVKL